MIHKYSMNGYNIVLDVNSGGVHVVDDLTYQILDDVCEPMDEECPQKIVDRLKQNYTEEEIRDSYAELYELYRQDMLYSSDDYEQFADKMVASPVKAMCLHIAHDCNLRCKYCFASTGDFGGGRSLMDVETGKKAIDFLIEKSAGRA